MFTLGCYMLKEVVIVLDTCCHNLKHFKTKFQCFHPLIKHTTKLNLTTLMHFWPVGRQVVSLNIYPTQLNLFKETRGLFQKPLWIYKIRICNSSKISNHLLFLSWPLFHIFVFSIRLAVNIKYKVCRWLDSTCRTLLLEATALPIEPQPKTINCYQIAKNYDEKSFM